MGSSTPDPAGAQWRKSNCSSTGGDCVEVAALDGARWRKSTHSGSTGGDCMEIADLGGTVAVRDSKFPDGPALALSPAAFAAFVRVAASGGAAASWSAFLSGAADASATQQRTKSRTAGVSSSAGSQATPTRLGVTPVTGP